jgi:hypothetical protein
MDMIEAHRKLSDAGMWNKPNLEFPVMHLGLIGDRV